MSQPFGVRKSTFINSGTDQIPASAKFDYVSSSQNFSVSFDNLLAQLGTTGQLVSVGDPLGVPILDDQGVIKGIRNLEEGFGISLSVSPEGGVEVSTAFSFDETGVVIVDDPDSPSPTFASLSAGTGINVSKSGDVIQVALVDEPTSGKTVVVSSLSDLPAPDSGIIALEDNTDYLFVSDIETPDRFIVGIRTIIRSAAAGVSTITYTGTGSMFTGVDQIFTLKDVTVACPSAALFDISGSIGSGVLQVLECQINECLSGGTIGTQFIIRFDGVSILDFKNDGYTFTGANQHLILDQGIFVLNGGTFLDFGGSTFDTVLVQNQVVQDSAIGTTLISGLASSGNINVGGLATVENTRVSGDTVALSGVSSSDIRWAFILNDDIPDTRPDGLISIFGNATETVIAVANTPVKAAGVWSIEDESHFSADTTGRITYNGEKPFRGPVDFSATILTAAGGDKQITVYIAINGVVIPQTGKQVTASSSKAGATSAIWQHTFGVGDYAEVWLENNDDTTNVILQQSVGRIN